MELAQSKYQGVYRNAAWGDHNARKKKFLPFSAAFELFHSRTEQSYTCFLLGQDLIAEPVKSFLRASDCALLDIVPFEILGVFCLAACHHSYRPCVCQYSQDEPW